MTDDAGLISWGMSEQELYVPAKEVADQGKHLHTVGQ